MKFFLPLFVAIAVTSAGVIHEHTKSYQEGDRFFYVADENENLHLVDSYEPANLDYIRNYTRNPNNNAYWLYTRANPTVEQVLVHGNANSVQNSNFDSNKITVFVAHGWTGSGHNAMSKLLTDAFLYNEDVNVIVLDWNLLAGQNYVTAKSGTAAVGRGLGQFVNWMTTLGLQLDRVHLVGFSLGAHLVGNAGRETNGRVARVTALDPAGPLWLLDSNRVRPTDGQYVEVIHTDIVLMGYRDPCGDADFYPNGGYGMPGCSDNSCSHSRAWAYMASSVKHNHFNANECNSLNDATRNTCTGSLNPMGNSNILKSRTGIFRVDTGSYYPY